MPPGRNGARQRGNLVPPPFALASALVAPNALDGDKFSRETFVAAGGADLLLVVLDELLIQPAGRWRVVVHEDEDHVLAVRGEEERSHSFRGIDVADIFPARGHF